jgi:hypothetical protein
MIINQQLVLPFLATFLTVSMFKIAKADISYSTQQLLINQQLDLPFLANSLYLDVIHTSHIPCTYVQHFVEQSTSKLLNLNSIVTKLLMLTISF